MTAPAAPRPQRIAALEERLREIGRERIEFRKALRESNDERHQDFFGGLLDRIDLILANARQGLTVTLADDLLNARIALRRLPLSDIDPDYGEATPALRHLRGARGNLVEALENALEAAAAIDLHPRDADLGIHPMARAPIAELLIRLDERLRIVEDVVTDLDRAARRADAEEPVPGVSQRGLVNVHVQTLKVEVSAARFETKVSNLVGLPDVDLPSLGRAVGAMREVASDLRQAVDGLGGLIAAPVRDAGRAVVRAARRSGLSLRLVVARARGRFAGVRGEAPAAVQGDPARLGDPPSDFNIKTVIRMVLAGEGPPHAWRPWIRELDLSGLDLSDTSPLAGLSSLRTLTLDGTAVADLKPLAGLSSLQRLTLDGTAVADLAPLAGLSSLQALTLNRTAVADLAPLAGLSSLQTLTLDQTAVADLAPLAGLSSLQTLSLNQTAVADLAPLAGLSSLQTLDLDRTAVADLAPLAAGSGLTVFVSDGARRERLRRTLPGSATSVRVENPPWSDEPEAGEPAPSA